MPGNEVGDRVHNFFGQENLSQGQYNSQAVEGNWPGLSNNLWASSQRTADAPFVSNLKNFNVQQSDFEQGHINSPRLRHGLNLPQSNLRQECSRIQLQNQQTAVNGYMQGHQAFQTRQNEANILGVDTESNWNSISRGMSGLESQGSGLELYRKNLTRNDSSELPVNYDFFGAQQQISSRHPGMLQSISRQPSGINDIQMLQQQVMLTQMQELQRQHQFHQLEARQQNCINPASFISKHTVGNHTASLINGMPINEASNLACQPDMASANNTNWLQRGASPVMQGSSNAHLLSPEQRQALRLMGLAPNQGDQSLYGLPISSSRGTLNLYSHTQVDNPAISQISIPHQFSHVQGDKPALPNISASCNSFPTQQCAAFSDQSNTNDGTSVSRQDIEGKHVFGSTVQGINSGLNMGNLQHVNSEQRNLPMQDFHARQELAGSTETSQDKMAVQVPSPSQNVAALDPTEEKILFGSDESLWGALGRNTGDLNMLDGTDDFNGFPSLHSGSWSALMQSAVAETSSSDIGVQEEWSSLSFSNTKCLPGNEQSSTIDSGKQQPVWAENNSQSASYVNSRPVHWPDDVNRTNVSVNYSGVPGFNRLGLDNSHEQHDKLQTDSSQRFLPQLLEKDKRKKVAEGSHIHGNATNSSGIDINDKGLNGNLQVRNEESGINGITALPNSGTTWVNRQSNQQLPNSLKGDVWRDADSSGSYRENEGPGKYRHHMKNPLVLESSMNEKAEGESHDMDYSKSDKSKEGLRSNSALHRAGGTRENVCFGDNGLRSQKSTNQVNTRHPPLSHKFQYHSMGDLGVDVEPSHDNKHVENSHQIPLHLQSFGGLKGQDQSYPGQSKFQHTEMDKGDSKGLVDNTSKGILPGHIQKQLTAFDRSVGNYDSNKTASPSQNILELLQKVDQSREHEIPTNTSTSNCHLYSRVTDTEASNGPVVHPHQCQTSLSQGFGLQLAPPTQRLPRVSSQGSVLTTSHVASETGIKGHTWLASTQTSPSQESSHRELGHIFDKASPYSVLGNIPQASTSGFPFSRIHTQNQNTANIGTKVANTNDMENTNKTEKSTEALGSNSAHHRDGGVRENVCFDSSDLRSPKLSNQVNQKPPVSGKFQYHPMGDLGVNVESSYGNKHVMNLQPMPQQPFGGQEGQNQSYLGQSKFGHTDEDHNVTEGNVLAFQGDSKSLVDSTSNSLLTGHKKKLASCDRRLGGYAPNKTALSRVLDTDSSDGSVMHSQQNQSSSSQGFGLQLAPPTQRLPVVSSHGSSEAFHTMSHVASETGDKDHTLLASTQTLPSPESSNVEHRRNISGTLGQIFDKPSAYSGNIPQAFTSGFPFSRILTQNPNMVNHGRHVENSLCANVTYIDRTASMNQIDEYCERPQSGQSELASVQEMSHLSGADQIHSRDPGLQTLESEAGTAPQPCVTFGESQHGAPSKLLQNVWASVSSKQHPNPSKIPSCSQLVNDCEMRTRPQKPGDKDSEKDDNDLADVGPCSVYSNSSGGKEQQLNEIPGQQIFLETADAAEEAVSASYGKDSVQKCTPDGSSPAATSRDIEAFGRSLRPSNFLQQSFSLLHQVQSMKSMEFDPGNRDAKRLKISNNAMDKQDVASNCGQQLSCGYNAIVKDVSGKHSSLPPSDPHMLNFLSKQGNGQDINTSSLEVLGYGQKNALQVSDSSKATSARSEHSVNPQMPSWFEQYGTFKNGKILASYDLQNMTPPKIMDQPSVIENQSEGFQVCNSVEQVNSIRDNDANQPVNSRQSPISASVVSEHVPSQLLPPAVEPDSVITRPKKRKSAISELVPWHKELAEGFERLRNISEAESDWARAANRLIEKIEEDAEIVEDLPLMLKSKRRLVLTSQLMQQLLNPPSKAFLSADVKLYLESVVYYVARLALGDACSSVSWSGGDALMLPGVRNNLSENLKSSHKIDQYILKIVEDLVGRAKKLENDILRLDSRASISDLRVECQDLERYSVINRFAKFHDRGQSDRAETSSSSDAAANARGMCLQRYVTVCPMPRNLPDRVQCLSL